MADPEHFKILKNGAEDWDKWRQQEKRVLWAPDLSGSNMSGMTLYGINLSRTNLSKANLSKASLHGANFRGANLRKANLSEALLYGAKLSRPNPSTCSTDASEYERQHLGAQLRKACLRNAHLMDADLRETDLHAADLSGAWLHNADLRGADLSEANLSGAVFSETVFGKTDLANAIGLESCEHQRPSTIDIRTLQQSPSLPLAFLRGCGLPESFIDYLPSQLNKPFEFFTCFISFTEADDTFSELLYNDLQNNGVRCWRWKENARIGRTLIHSIDEAVRLYDKLIVICSGITTVTSSHP